MRKSVAIGLGFLLASGTVWAQQYLISTVAGGGVVPTPAPATSMALSFTGPVAADQAGNVYFSSNNTVLKVDPSGVLALAAGSSAFPGYSGDGGPATDARLNAPGGLAVDAAGNLYIADTGNYVIRKVAAATGIITTVAGNGTPGLLGDGGQATAATLNRVSAVAVDSSGNLYIADGYFSTCGGFLVSCPPPHRLPSIA